jgi:hypothetical protein
MRPVSRALSTSYTIRSAIPEGTPGFSSLVPLCRPAPALPPIPCQSWSLTILNKLMTVRPFSKYIQHFRDFQPPQSKVAPPILRTTVSNTPKARYKHVEVHVVPYPQVDSRLHRVGEEVKIYGHEHAHESSSSSSSTSTSTATKGIHPAGILHQDFNDGNDRLVNMQACTLQAPT